MQKRGGLRATAFLIQRRKQARRFGPDFIGLYWIGRKSDPKRNKIQSETSPRLLPFNEKK
jgi:hypothetical protein